MNIKKIVILITIPLFSYLCAQEEYAINLSQREKSCLESLSSCIACCITVGSITTQQPCAITTTCSICGPLGCYCCFNAVRRELFPDHCQYCDLCLVENFPEQHSHLENQIAIKYHRYPFTDTNEFAIISFPSNNDHYSSSLGIAEHPNNNAILHELTMSYAKN